MDFTKHDKFMRRAMLYTLTLIVVTIVSVIRLSDNGISLGEFRFWLVLLIVSALPAVWFVLLGTLGGHEGIKDKIFAVVSGLNRLSFEEVKNSPQIFDSLYGKGIIETRFFSFSRHYEGFTKDNMYVWVYWRKTGKPITKRRFIVSK